MELAKLDSYDYVILPGTIRILISGSNDPDIVDIMSEISRAEGSIYVDGFYYSYLDIFTIDKNENGYYMDLQVSLVA